MHETRKSPERSGRRPVLTPGVARWAGKAALAAGFLLGTYGLTEESPAVMKAGLGLLATGILALSYGLFATLVSRSHQPDE